MTKNYKLPWGFFLIMLILSGKAFSQIPNANLESWYTTGFPSYNEPTGWGTLNSQTAIIGTFTVEKATGANAHWGSAAMKLSSHYIAFAGQTAPGISVTGTINTNTQEFEGGFVQTTKPTHLVGWYKAAPAANDNGRVELRFFKRINGIDSTVAEALFETNGAVSSYTRFMVPITYHTTIQPDSGRVSASSSNPLAPQDGSVLYIDDLRLVDCSTLAATAAATDATTVGGNNGSVTSTPTGGAGTYTYSWTTGANTQNITGVAPGNYCVVVTDSNGCSVSACATVGQPSCTGFSASVTATDVTTNGGSDGTVNAVTTGGTAGYTYSWDNNVTTQGQTGLAAGNYCVTVTDAVNCTAAACGLISSPSCSGFSVAVSTTDATTNGGTDGTATATTTGGTGPYAFSWGSGTGNPLNNLAAGSYCVTVTDAATCIATACGTVNEPSCTGFSVTVSATDATTVNGTDGSATATVTGGSGGNTYTWSTGGTTVTINNLGAGAYCVTVTNSVNCTAQACDTVMAPSCTGFAVSVAVTDASSATANDGSATATVTGGNGGNTYNWSNNATTGTINNVGPGTYCVTASDNAGCTASACDSVSAPVGINEHVFASVKVFPNPAKDVLTIQNNSNLNLEFSLYSVEGKLVAERKLTQTVSTIYLGGINSGSYTYKLKDAATLTTQYGKVQIVK